MVLTRLEKLAFAMLIALIGTGFLMLIVRVSAANQQSRQLLLQIAHIAGLTDYSVLVKGDAYNVTENAGKLNLNRTDLRSIKALPQMTPGLAQKIFDYVKERGEIKDLNELLNVKGMTKKRIRMLENYATAVGGHAGQAAWGEKLNLNFASIEDINALPGVSKNLAEKIVSFRDSNGGLFSLEDLKEVPGLTDKTLKKFIDLVEVR
ncbi:MAG: helix-hairpin-helix domain-containing protein [Candidatus Riflebacteria bacterium]|jgi:competence protein ComEA|nr:helix-hairpin-helix domain-containing protein [Candidatus Riflebacteria bacterium]